MSINIVIEIGRLCDDPDVKLLPGTKIAVAKLRIAVNKALKKGAKEPETQFYNVSVVGAEAENCEKYLRKGRLVAVVGELDNYVYEDKETGMKKYGTNIRANHVEFLERGENKRVPQTSAEAMGLIKECQERLNELQTAFTMLQQQELVAIQNGGVSLPDTKGNVAVNAAETTQVDQQNRQNMQSAPQMPITQTPMPISGAGVSVNAFRYDPDDDNF